MKIEWQVLLNSLEELFKYVERQESREKEFLVHSNKEWDELDEMISTHFNNHRLD